MAGEPAVVLVGGQAGVGKSRLLQAAFDGQDGVRALTGACIQLGGDGLPFVPLAQDSPYRRRHATRCAARSGSRPIRRRHWHRSL